MAMKSFKEIALDHMKNMIIRLGNCYSIVYFDDGETFTIDPNNRKLKLNYLDNDESNKIDVSNDDDEPEDEESEDRYELDPDDEEEDDE